MAGDGEVEADPERCSGVPPAPSSRSMPTMSRDAERLVVVLGRLQRDVVAEPLRLLVRVGVAAHVDQQRGVVDGRALGLVEADELTEPQRDQALAQHVLHRLAEPEIDPQRQRREQLGQPHRRGSCRPSAHEGSARG